MKYVLFAVLGAVSLAALSIPAFSSTVTPQPLATRAHTIHVQPTEIGIEDSVHFKALEAYVLDAMETWAPAATIAGTHSQDGFASIARDVVAVVLNPGEPALFKNDLDRSRTATLLATLAYFEGHLWPYVDEGICNDPKQKNNPILKNGNCDGGFAVSQWQIHPGRGIVLFDTGSYGYVVGRGSDKGSTEGGVRTPSGFQAASAVAGPPSVDSLSDPRPVATAETLKDRRFAAKVALHMLRTSLKRDGSLREYTGELQSHPKADQRLKFAREWSDKHPFVEPVQ
jgi:hypothetical protein